MASSYKEIIRANIAYLEINLTDDYNSNPILSYHQEYERQKSLRAKIAELRRELAAELCYNPD